MTRYRDEQSPPAGRVPLTARQRDILEYLQLFMSQRGFPPTLREAAAEFGIQHKALEAKRYIERDVATARGIRIVAAGGRQEFGGGAGI